MSRHKFSKVNHIRRIQASPPSSTSTRGTEASQGPPAVESTAHIFSAVMERSVKRSGLSQESFVRSLTASAFGRLIVWSESDLERLLVTAERLCLDPLGGEIYAMPRTSLGGVGSEALEQFNSPVLLALSIDGWCRVINSSPQFDGMSFTESQEQLGGLPVYMECALYRKDRRVATPVREYMSEANTASGAWLTHPRRMLRHKAMVQCARLSFGLGCLYEPDEADRIRSAADKRELRQNLNPEAGHGFSQSGLDHAGRAGGPGIRHRPPSGSEAVRGWLQERSAK